MAGLDTAALAALAQLAKSSDDEATITAEEGSAAPAADTDVVCAEAENQERARAIARELLERDNVEFSVPLAQQGAGDLDIAALISRLERELGITIPDSYFAPRVSLATLLGEE